MDVGYHLIVTVVPGKIIVHIPHRLCSAYCGHRSGLSFRSCYSSRAPYEDDPRVYTPKSYSLYVMLAPVGP